LLNSLLLQLNSKEKPKWLKLAQANTATKSHLLTTWKTHSNPPSKDKKKKEQIFSTRGCTARSYATKMDLLAMTLKGLIVQITADTDPPMFF